jgi:cobalt-zinc-cadmium efflux system protein
MFKPWYWLDPVVSWVIVGMIFYGGWGLLRDSYHILMNATPPGIDLQEIREAVESVEGVREIHHLHVWNPSPQTIALAAHITVPDQMLSSVDAIAAEIRERLWSRFKIDHPILQFETNGCAASGLIICSSRRDHDRT